MNNPEYIETHIEKSKKTLRLKKSNKIIDLDNYSQVIYIKMNNSIISIPFVITDVEVGNQGYRSSTEIKLTLRSIY